MSQDIVILLSYFFTSLNDYNRMLMKINKENAALLIIDMQEKILPAMTDVEELIDNCMRLVKGCQELNIPVISTVQYRKGLGDIIPQINLLLNGREPEPVEKFEFSCMQNDNFYDFISKLNRNKIIVVGIESHVCVQQTVLDLIHADYHPIVIADCIASRKHYDKRFALERMRDYGADITTHESVLFELLVTSKAPEFKEISNIIK